MVTKIPEQHIPLQWMGRRFDSKRNDLSAPESLFAYSNHKAWVLLGDAGAGKSDAFRSLSVREGGCCRTASEFIDLPMPPDWHEPVFIDGLDEITGANNQTALGNIRRKLQELGLPRFRLSCREADWRGSSDREALIALVSDDQFSELHLEPLERSQAEALVAHWQGGDEDSAKAFIAGLHARGLDGLLNNPMTLQMWWKAVSGANNEWPATKRGAYTLACRQLLKERNANHRSKKHSLAISEDSLLQAAGYIAALLLLSGEASVLNNPGDSDNERGLELSGLPDLPGAPELPALQAVVQTRLFKGDGAGNFSLVHRTIAEFLAADFLAAKLLAGLPARRIEALILDQNDDLVISGLRGLAGWLATLAGGYIRQRLIASDPQALVLYGDPADFSQHEKAQLLDSLAAHATPEWQIRQWRGKRHPFVALVSAEQLEKLGEYLVSPSRAEGHLVFLACVLDAMLAASLRQLRPNLLPMIHDTSYPWYVRLRAAAVLVHYLGSEQDWTLAEKMLEAVWNGELDDDQDELLGLLLAALYPARLPATRIWRYARKPQRENLWGNYRNFWYELKSSPETELPVLLDGMCASDFRLSNDGLRWDMQETVGELLARAISVYGANTDIPRLYAWLGLGLTVHGTSALDIVQKRKIADWLHEHPVIYRNLFEHGLRIVDGEQGKPIRLIAIRLRLCDAKEPLDVADWLFALAHNTTNKQLQLRLVQESCRSELSAQRPDNALIKLEKWREAHEEDAEWVSQQLVKPFPAAGEEREELAHKQWQQQRDLQASQQRRLLLSRVSKTFRLPNADLWALESVADTWLDHFPAEHGLTAEARLRELCQDEQDLVDLAKHGLRQCLYREDFPTVEAIVQLMIQGSRYALATPALAAADLIHAGNPTAFFLLPAPLLRALVAFYWLMHLNQRPVWYEQLLSARPLLIADVLLLIAGKEIAAGKEHPQAIYQLAYADDYRVVARAIAPTLFRQFPVKAAKKMWFIQQRLLVALVHALDGHAVLALLDEKLAQRGLSVWQQVNCLMTAALLAPAKYLSNLKRYAGNSEQRLDNLRGFLLELGERTYLLQELPIVVAGYMLQVLNPTSPPDLHTTSVLMVLLNRLVNDAGAEAAGILEGLVEKAHSDRWRYSLEVALNNQKANRRNAEYTPSSVPQLCRALNNLQPASAADLWALTIENLLELVHDIRSNPTNDYLQYWKGDTPRLENECRNALLSDLNLKMASMGVQAAREASHADDTRADINVIYGQWKIPLEAKKEDDGAELWSAIPKQLIAKYCRERSCDGFGIYLVFWFGGHLFKGTPTDGGNKPKTPTELEQRLQATVPAEFKHKIKVLVVDCSRPTK